MDCSVNDCKNASRVKGMCSRHFNRMKRYGNPLAGGVIRDRNIGCCMIEECNKPATKKSMCQGHYLRNWRYGDPELGSTPRGQAIDWLLAHVDYQGDDCLIWPFYRNPKGYGDVNFADETGLAHRVMCKLAHGQPPLPDMDAAHSCHNGHLGCINQKHLSWKTHIENLADKLNRERK